MRLKRLDLTQIFPKNGAKRGPIVEPTVEPTAFHFFQDLSRRTRNTMCFCAMGNHQQWPISKATVLLRMLKLQFFKDYVRRGSSSENSILLGPELIDASRCCTKSSPDCKLKVKKERSTYQAYKDFFRFFLIYYIALFFSSTFENLYRFVNYFFFPSWIFFDACHARCVVTRLTPMSLTGLWSNRSHPRGGVKDRIRMPK